MRKVTRRQLLCSVGLSSGAGLLVGSSGKKAGSPREDTRESGRWAYVRLNSAAVAAEAYRLFPEGACMYGLFASIVTSLGRMLGEPYRSFPLHMMRYGQGGVGGWGSLCGTLNGAAAVFGLLEKDASRREQLITELFSWYEGASLPTYCPPGVRDSLRIPGSKAGSVLCHASVARWCKVSGAKPSSKEMVERCRRLTADVAAKTVALLNQGLEKSDSLPGQAPEVQSCLSCHGQGETRVVVGKMSCGSCHSFTGKHPKP